MPIPLIGAGIAGIGSIVGGIIGSKASTKAANIQDQNAQRVADMAQTAAQQAQQGAGQAVATANGYLGDAQGKLGDLYGQQTNNLQPYLQAGQQGINTLATALAPGGALATQFQAPSEADVEATPGYQFQLNEGLKALQRSQAAAGLTQSGGNLKAITQYAQDLASTNYGNAYNRALQTYQTNFSNMLNGNNMLANYGQNANSQFNNVAQNYGSTYSNLASGLSGNTINTAQYEGNVGIQGADIAGRALTAGANAKAAGTVGSANAWQGAIGGLTNAGNFYTLSDMMKYAGTSPVANVPGGITGGVPGGIPYLPPLGSPTIAPPPTIPSYNGGY